MRKTHPEVVRSKAPAPKLSISKPKDGLTKKHDNTPAKPGKGGSGLFGRIKIRVFIIIYI